MDVITTSARISKKKEKYKTMINISELGRGEKEELTKLA